MEAVKLPEGAPAMSPPRATAGRRIATGLGVTLFGLALSGIAAETALRLAGYRMPVLLPDSVRATYHLGRNSQFLYLGYLPGAVEDYATPVALNNLGFHDNSYAPERPSPSSYRIMVLGDSYVAAWEVPLEE